MAKALLDEQVTSAFFASTDPVAMAVTMKMDYAQRFKFYRWVSSW
jgi:hypothetical protein